MSVATYCLRCRTEVEAAATDDEPCPRCGAPTRLKARWRIVGPLARGGSARVFRGLDTETEREVALKILDLADVEDWKQVELFERQLPLLRRLRHRGIPEVFDAFEHVHDGRTQLVLVQALHDGPNLRDALAGDVRFDDRTARAFLGRMLDILEYLHGFSPPILHRDIKPANVLLELPADGDLANAQPILIDFDTARGIAIDPTVADGTMVGSAGFVPLEQLAGRPTPASDLYALGMTMIAALSRRELVELPVTRSKLQFRAFVNVSDQLAGVLDKMIEPIVEDRFADVAAVRHALSASPRRAPSTPSTPTKKRFPLVPVVVVVGIVGIVGTILIAGVFRPRKEPRPAPPTPAPAQVASPPARPPASTRSLAGTICRTTAMPCEVVPSVGDRRFFGQSAAISGTTLAVGSGDQRGGVYVFTRDATSWNNQAVLDPPHDEKHGQFGRKVALAGDTLVVGARLAYERFGAVFVYVREGTRWQLQADLRGPRAESMFGERIALSGDTLAVNETYRENTASRSAIALYVRRAGAWTVQQRLAGFREGVTVALDGDTLALVVPGGTVDDASPAIMLYRRTGDRWTLETRIRTTQPSPSTVALAGDMLVIPSRDPARRELQVFTRSDGAWTQHAVVPYPPTADPPDTGWHHVPTIALSGQHLAIAHYVRKPTPDGLQLDHTSVWLFAKHDTSFRFERVIDASLVEEAPLALDGTTLVLGAAHLTASNRDRALWPGAAFVFSL